MPQPLVGWWGHMPPWQCWHSHPASLAAWSTGARREASRRCHFQLAGQLPWELSCFDVCGQELVCRNATGVAKRQGGARQHFVWVVGRSWIVIHFYVVSLHSMLACTCQVECLVLSLLTYKAEFTGCGYP